MTETVPKIDAFAHTNKLFLFSFSQYHARHVQRKYYHDDVFSRNTGVFFSLLFLRPNFVKKGQIEIQKNLFQIETFNNYRKGLSIQKILVTFQNKKKEQKKFAYVSE